MLILETEGYLLVLIWSRKDDSSFGVNYEAYESDNWE